MKSQLFTERQEPAVRRVLVAVGLLVALTGCASAGGTAIQPTFEPNPDGKPGQNMTPDDDANDACEDGPAACDGQCCPELPPSGYNFAINDMREGDLHVDAKNIPHIVYRSSSGEVRHAEYRDSRWRVSRISATPGYGIAITSDAAGNTHACYRDAEDQTTAAALQYVRLENGTWIKTSFANTVGNCAIALDKGGEAHLLYRSTMAGLVYARHSGANWIQAVVPATTPKDLQIAVNGDGLTHMAFIDDIGGVPTVRYTNTNDVKTVVTLATGSITDLVMRATSKNAAYLLFVRANVTETGDEVDFAQNTAMGWQSSAVIGNLGTGVTLDMAIDGHDHTHALINRPGEPVSLYTRIDGAFNAEATLQDFVTTTAHVSSDAFGRSHVLGVDDTSVYGTFTPTL